MGMKDEEGNPLEPLERPGKKVSLSDGLAQWQKDLREYGLNQGFTIK
jgi:multiple sugar transport system substrate-binding protein